MSEFPKRHHALENFLRSTVAMGDENAGVKVEIRPQLDYVNLRGDPDDREFLSTAQGVMSQALPLDANTMKSGAVTAYSLAPGEWLLTADEAGGIGLAESLEKSLGEMHASVNALSGGYVAMRISGPDAAALLAKGCTFDLHPRNFSTGHCVQTGLGKANVIVAKVDGESTFELLVRRSFAEYVALWLQHAGTEYGISFSSTE